ncbi:hypothetical protein LCGC14_1614900 [marine sediment metagenome]|uniref:PIN domain-containing protein n=1 Tax=marine sediment metagenome TaxID=412755 RepID=A0A0F9ITY9_9ZZZZ
MVLESKPHEAEVLKETNVLLLDASAVYYAIKLYDQCGEGVPDRLVEMFEERLKSALQNISDIVHPIPF